MGLVYLITYHLEVFRHSSFTKQSPQIQFDPYRGARSARPLESSARGPAAPQPLPSEHRAVFARVAVHPLCARAGRGPRARVAGGRDEFKDQRSIEYKGQTDEEHAAALESLRQAQEEVQKITDSYIKKIDDLVKGKEKDLLTL